VWKKIGAGAPNRDSLRLQQGKGGLCKEKLYGEGSVPRADVEGGRKNHPDVKGSDKRGEGIVNRIADPLCTVMSGGASDLEARGGTSALGGMSLGGGGQVP